MSLYSQTELRPASVPLISLSRSPSPYARRSSNSNLESDTDEEEDLDNRPSLLARGSRKRGFAGFFLEGGLGQWVFATWLGWQLYVSLVVLWCMAASVGLTLLNVLTLSTGVYKFPYPITLGFVELCLTHLLLWTLAGLTRLASRYLAGMGFAGMISPSTAPSQPTYRATARRFGFFPRIAGIAGGGLFEFNLKLVRQMLPLAIVYTLKVLFSTMCLAYTQYSMYVQCRIAIVPLSLLFTTYICRTSHSIPVLSATLTATLTLMVATHRANVRVAWDAIVAGIASSICVALYPVLLQKTFTSQVAALMPQADLLSDRQGESSADASGSKEEARASWSILHYVSLISIMIYIPILILSGEIGNISRNCYFLDSSFLWLILMSQGIVSWGLFFGTFLLARATSPLTTTFTLIPQVAFLYPFVSNSKVPAYSWIGIAMCWASIAWFVRAQRSQGRLLERLGRLRT
ncbi:MAG: hypothetical protein M1818_003281 [Claussenomyces sp. TS43310]|nr:MAG: hypothetical protein M1818_003281 [Claussenomyces sp. TS43310]